MRVRGCDRPELAEAKVDLGAISDFATRSAWWAMTRAYADWSVPANAAYRKDLVDRAVDLVQLFAAPVRRTAPTSGWPSTRSRTCRAIPTSPTSCSSPAIPTTSRSRSGASDLVATFIGIGVAGSTSSALVERCDEFAQYEQLPGVTRNGPTAVARQMAASAPEPRFDEEGRRPHEGRRRKTSRAAAKGGVAPSKNRLRRPLLCCRGRWPVAQKMRRRMGLRRSAQEPDEADRSGVRREGAGVHHVQELR